MAWGTRVLLVVLAFALVALLAGGTAAAAVGLSAGGAEAMPPSLHALRRRVEDDASSFVEGEEAAAPRRRALYSSGSINYAALTSSKAACYGPCPARGQAYSRGCLAIYQCRG
jgi:hypothetical protein